MPTENQVHPQDERNVFTVSPNTECGGYDVFERGDDEPVAWFADQQGAEDWVYYVVRHPPGKMFEIPIDPEDDYPW